jgi:hypothetical protein
LRVEVDETAKTVTTHFDDGTKVVAAPVYDEESEARALDLGYRGADPVWQMTRDHDRVHSLLARARGLPFSPTLWAVAHGQPVPATANEEERIVFLVVRAANLGIDALAARA